MADATIASASSDRAPTSDPSQRSLEVPPLHPEGPPESANSVVEAKVGGAEAAIEAGGSADRETRQPVFVDLASELRSALGFQGVGHDESTPSLTSASLTASPRSHQLVVPEPAESLPPTATARNTPEGRYMELVHRILLQRWFARDLALGDRARGVQGQVRIAFSVAANGRVSGARVARASGFPALDELALDAIPLRLPEFLDDMPRESVEVEMGFRYRNEMVGSR